MSQEPISLRRATPADAADFARINSHPDVQPNLMQLPHGNVERWRQILTDNDQPCLLYTSDAADE